MKKKKWKSAGTNAIDPASPASVWGKGVPGKGGVSTNYDASKNDFEIWVLIRDHK
jgi:hypothetical protein